MKAVPGLARGFANAICFPQKSQTQYGFEATNKPTPPPPAKFPKSYLSSDDPQAKAPKRKIVEGSERIVFNSSSQKGKVACPQPQNNKSQRTFPSDSPDTKVSKRQLRNNKQQVRMAAQTKRSHLLRYQLPSQTLPYGRFKVKAPQGNQVMVTP